jgi:hypothetical protein
MSYKEDVLYAAVKACNGSSADRGAWFRQWAHEESPTTVEYSQTCILLAAAQKLADQGGLLYHEGLDDCDGHVILVPNAGFCKWKESV